MEKALRLKGNSVWESNLLLSLLEDVRDATPKAPSSDTAVDRALQSIEWRNLIQQMCYNSVILSFCLVHRFRHVNAIQRYNKRKTYIMQSIVLRCDTILKFNNPSYLPVVRI